MGHKTRLPRPTRYAYARWSAAPAAVKCSCHGLVHTSLHSCTSLYTACSLLCSSASLAPRLPDHFNVCIVWGSLGTRLFLSCRLAFTSNSSASVKGQRCVEGRRGREAPPICAAATRVLAVNFGYGRILGNLNECPAKSWNVRERLLNSSIVWRLCDNYFLRAPEKKAKGSRGSRHNRRVQAVQCHWRVLF